MIAQELVEILPKMVNQESTGVYGVDVDNLTWHLVKAIQELSTKNNDLETQLNATANMSELEQRVHELEQRLI